MRDPDDYLFMELWQDDVTPIDWQRRGRRRLNRVIMLFNTWQKGPNGFSRDIAEQQLLPEIYDAHAQLDVDGGGAWVEQLEKMEEHVRRML